jgi:hypothetical protein
VGSHIRVALFQAQVGMANGFAQGTGPMGKYKGFSEMLVTIVCHESLLGVRGVVTVCNLEAEWGLNFTRV